MCEQKTHIGVIDTADSESHGSFMEFAQTDPNPQDFGKEPPPLPPHFHQAYLPMNKVSDGDQPPTPSHVLLNHAMYATTTAMQTSLRDNVEMLRVSSAIRFRGKFITIILHKPLPSTQATPTPPPTLQQDK
eukprot:c10442_g1_i1.p1 GENE.c10442_g1_i1~~c10442_g1_i1.p1  ORF type:complete len:131 (-),score=36.90 c10442_g1_i1:133-525(-)